MEFKAELQNKRRALVEALRAIDLLIGYETDVVKAAPAANGKRGPRRANGKRGPRRKRWAPRGEFEASLDALIQPGEKVGTKVVAQRARKLGLKANAQQALYHLHRNGKIGTGGRTSSRLWFRNGKGAKS